MLGTTIQNLVPWVTWHTEFEQPWSKDSYFIVYIAFFPMLYISRHGTCSLGAKTGIHCTYQKTLATSTNT